MADGTASPQRIDRYDVVGRLATGGMAEVLLGRLCGPHGFERAVVIKRMLPHLTGTPAIVDLFLDEARIIAKLRHPNLIHVHELGRDGDELFIAMEFLEGESVAGLCRRLASRHEHLDYALAAHVIAEACAGLHAAHEAKAQDGRPLQIVHRDISPQNIFVTYAGAVVVIDFGIATTVDRIARTEPGTVRGKFEYMAPEQARALPLDRRADLFSLGVVLMELASGRRVYKRATQAEALLAVMNDPPPKLSTFRPGAPPELEAICSRALAKNRADRYETAAEMRRDLLTFVRKSAEVDATERLGSLMHTLFSERIAEKAELLQRVRQGTEVAHVPAAEIDAHIDIPTAFEEPPSAATALSQTLATARTQPARVVRGLSAAVGLGLLGALGLGLTVSRATSHPSPTMEPGMPSADVPASAAATASPSLTPSAVHVKIESSPPAKVNLQGSLRGTTPLDLVVDRSSDPLEIEVRADGFVPERRTFSPDTDQTFTFVLSRTAPPPAPLPRSAALKGGAKPSAAPVKPALPRTSPTVW